MGKYDAIYGAGNVTVEAPPDFWTAAKQSFDDDYDRLVEADERQKEEDRYNETQRISSEQRVEEKQRYRDQKELDERKLGREEWELMYDNARNASQRAMVYKSGLNSGVSGLTPGGLTAEEDKALIDFTNNEMLNNYYSASDAEKVELFPELRSALIKSGNPSDKAMMAPLQKDYETRRGNVENKEVIQMIADQYGDVFSPQLKSFFENTGDISDTQLTMATDMLKTSLASTQKTEKEKYDFAQALIGMQTKGEFPSQEQINTVTRANMIGYQLYQSLIGGGPPKDELSALPQPTLENLDEILTGKEGSFDKISDKRKEEIFNKVIKKHAANWSTMSDAEKVEAGEKIEAEINKTKYETAPQEAGIGGKFGDPEYEGAESITNEMIDAKFEEILKKRGIVGDRRKMASKETLKKYRDRAESDLLKEMRGKSRKKAKKVARRGYPPHGKYSFLYEE